MNKPTTSSKNRPKGRYYKRSNSNKKPSVISKMEENTHLTKDHFFLVKSFKRTTDKLIEYIDPCSETQLLWSVNTESWNIKEILSHLSQTNDLYLNRLNSVLEEAEPTFVNFDANVEIKKEEFSSYSIERLLATFLRGRKEIEALCMRTMNEDWEKKGTHPTNGLMTFKEVVAYITKHDETHLNQIFMNLQRHDPWLKSEPVKEAAQRALEEKKEAIEAAEKPEVVDSPDA